MMPEHPSDFLSPWANFYVTMGTSSASLIGLMFVVITLVNDRERARSREATATFSTPTVVHFSGALLISAILNAPWRSLLHLCVVLGLAGVCGVVYVLRVAYRMKSVPGYAADAEDWTWHTVVPLLAYGAILAASLASRAFPGQALFALAAGVVLLIFTGIHNAWDIVTYVAIKTSDQPTNSVDAPDRD